MEEKIFEGIKYLVCYPEGFREDKKHPLILYLHGAGTRGENTDRLQKNICLVNLRKFQDAAIFRLVMMLPEDPV